MQADHAGPSLEPCRAAATKHAGPPIWYIRRLSQFGHPPKEDIHDTQTQFPP